MALRSAAAAWRRCSSGVAFEGRHGLGLALVVHRDHGEEAAVHVPLHLELFVATLPLSQH
jgi:hypothetical protein